jgi:hypothetical protein
LPIPRELHSRSGLVVVSAVRFGTALDDALEITLCGGLGRAQRGGHLIRHRTTKDTRARRRPHRCWQRCSTTAAPGNWFR